MDTDVVISVICCVINTLISWLGRCERLWWLALVVEFGSGPSSSWVKLKGNISGMLAWCQALLGLSHIITSFVLSRAKAAGIIIVISIIIY